MHNRRTPLHIVACLMAAITIGSAIAATKPSKWDQNALRRKADYIYLEASHRKALDQNDAYFDLANRAVELNPNEKLMPFELAIYSILISNRDSAAVAQAYSTMLPYFEANPSDLFNSTLFARISDMVGRPDMSLYAWQRMHDVFPDRDDVTLRYAEKLFNSPDEQNRRKALAIYDSIEAIQGKDLQISNMKIIRFVEEHDTLAVWKELDALLHSYPKNAQVASFVGDVHMVLGDTEGALGYYIGACEADSTDGYAFYSLANYYNRIGDKAGYDREIINALRKKSLDLDTKLEIFKSFIVGNEESETVGQIDNAENVADEFVEEELVDSVPDSDNDTIYIDVDSIYIDPTTEQRRQQITELFDILLDEYPHEADIYTFYAGYLMSIYEYPEAAEQLAKSLDIEPSDENRWLTLVSLDMQNDDTEAVEEHATRAMHFFPHNTQLKLMLAATYQHDRQNAKAAKILGEALALADSTDTSTISNIYSSLGDIYYSEGQKEKAMESYLKAIEFNPENWLAQNNYAYYMACEDKDLDKALLIIKRVIAAKPDDPTSLDTYAWVLFKLKNYKEAREAIDRCIANSTPESLVAEELDHAGDIYFMNGHRAEALDFWRRALQLEPNNDLIKRKIKHKTIFFE